MAERRPTSDVLAELMVLADHPAEPMVMHLHVHLKPGHDQALYNEAKLKQATLQLFREYPRLRSRYRCTEKGSGFVDPGESESEALVERAWQAQDLSLPAFRNSAIEVSSAPLIRFRFHPSEGLAFAVHHALCDGKAAMLMLLAFEHIVIGQKLAINGAGKVRRKRSRSIKLRQWWAILAEGIAQHRRTPPVLLGPTDPLTGSGHGFVTRLIPNQELRDLKRTWDTHYPGATTNDLLLTALHLCVGEWLEKQLSTGQVFGGRERISVLVPIDLRHSEDQSEPFANYSSSISVSSLPADRQDKARLLAQIRQRMARVRWHHLGYGFLFFMKLYEWFGVLEAARRLRIKHNLPRRAFASRETYWKTLDTIVLSNLGKLRLPEHSAVAAIEGYPPVIPPMGVGIDVATSEAGLHFWLRASNATLSSDQAEQFLSNFVAVVRNLASDKTSFL